MKQFDIKDSAEKVVLTFDFAADLATGETLAGALVTTIVTASGTDLSPISVFNGAASTDATNTLALVPVQGGADGCNYTLKVVSDTSNAKKVLALTALLPVRG